MERKELVELFNNEEYEKLEQIICKDNENDPFLQFLNAYMHETKEYYNFSLYKAKQIYEDCINRKDSVWQSYYYYAKHLLRNIHNNDQEKAICVLKKGLALSPRNDWILHLLLITLLPKDAENFIIEKVNIEDYGSSDIILPYLMFYCFNNRESILFRWLAKCKVLENYIQSEQFEVTIIIGYLFYIHKDMERAKIFFSHVANYANDLLKNFALLGIALASKDKEMEDAIENLPMSYCIEPIEYKIKEKLDYISLEEFLLVLFDEILINEKIKLDLKLKAKIRGIRGYYLFDKEQGGGTSDLKCAIKHFKIKEYFYALNTTYYYKDKYKEAFKYGIEYFYLATSEERSKEYCNFVIPDNKHDLFDLVKMVKSNDYRFYNSMNEFTVYVISPVIIELFNQKEYKSICELADSYKFDHIVNAVGFEVAYSYGECGFNEISKKYYKYLVDDSRFITAASLHNLANIYSDESDFKIALELRQKAIEISDGDAIYIEALNKENEKYSNFITMVKEEVLAVDNLRNENVWVIRILNNFYKHSQNGFIVCSYKLLPKYLHLSDVKADEMIHYFINKKYVRKATRNEHNINTQSTVYKINIEVYNALKEILNQEVIFDEFLNCLSDFSPSKLKSLGYDQTFLDKVKSINDANINEMINRDLRENIVALSTKSFKSALVISGSIVEALMIHKLKLNNIEKFKFEYSDGKEKTIKVGDMTLAQLILVAEKYNVFTHETLKHSDAIRGYRNLIHPGVEVRKSIDTPIVTEDNAQLAWMVLRKVISEM